ncbi:hypothetical protein BC952_2622 [Flavobacterium limicola]|uniref:Uncharacterized protein n=1 Tax=Flavobacterium limicola TaxID=180441 RepID=A0A495RYR1_9FLAO|nr:hypothetical protein [Flavobacterium limicola]RKS92707.1 hypothetical protein BC952_2622 [Flavobacterium limicola]
MLHNSIFFVDKIEGISICDSTMYYFTGSSFSRPTDFKRIENENHNLKNCKSCKKNHLIDLKGLESRLKNFPFCCDFHKSLINEKWFNKNDFNDVAKLTADKIYFTWDFIQKFVDEPEWEQEITDYLSHVIDTFGSFPVDYGEPLFLGSYLNRVKEMLKGLDEKKHVKKKQIILDHVNSYYLSTSKKKQSTDFNVLLAIYDKWFKTFPFDISIFKGLKEKFSKTLPIIEKTRYNKYSGLAIASPKTKSNLIKLLCNLTNEIVTEINSLKLYEEGKLNDLENYKLEIVLHKRKLKLKEGYQNDIKEPNSSYRNILKSWFSDEIDFIKEIEPTLQSIQNKKNNLYLDILYACSKMQENRIFWKADENARTKQILDLLEINYKTKDQSQSGVSATGIRPGSIDGIVIDSNRIQVIIEALNLKYLNKNYIQDHISKLEINYDNKGLKTKFLISYCDIANDTFQEFYEKYVSFINDEVRFQNLKQSFENLEPNYANQRILKTIHTREKVIVTIYHILLKM